MARSASEIFSKTLEHASNDVVAELHRYFEQHIVGHSRFKGMSPELLSEVTLDAFQRGLRPEHGPQLADHVFTQVKQAEQLAGVVNKPYSQWSAPGSMAQEQQTIAAKFAQGMTISPEQKLFAGLSLLTAGFSAVNAYGHAKHVRQTDGDGKTHTQWSQVGMALLSATFAAGLAYIGVQQARGRMGAF